MKKKALQKTPEQRARQEQAMERRTAREQFRRRKKSFFKGATGFGKACDSEIYILISRQDKFFEFKTKNRDGWPPSREEIDRNLDVQNMKTAADFPTTLEVEEEEGGNIPQAHTSPIQSIRIPTLPRLGKWPSINTDSKIGI